MAPKVSLVRPADLLPLVGNPALGDVSLDLPVASATLSVPVRLEPEGPLTVTFGAGAAFSIVAITGDSDPDGVVAPAGAATPAGTFTPPLSAGDDDVWLKYVCDANVSGDADVEAGLIKAAGEASAAITTADYRHHRKGDPAAPCILPEAADQQFALVRDHVANLWRPEAIGNAVMFRARGEVTASIEIDWADIFTSEISGLTGLLAAGTPVAITAGLDATCRISMTIEDTFVVVFARPVDGGNVRAAIRKGRVQKEDVTAGVSIAASVANPAALAQMVDSLLPMLPGAQRDAVMDQVAAIVRTKAEAAFTYEYHRVRSEVPIFEGEIAPGGPTPGLHRALVAGDLAAAIALGPAAIRLTRFLNETKTTMTEAYGFTLGFGKWKVFGQDRFKVDEVTRWDALKQTCWRSYIGSGGYVRTRLMLMGDFAATMRGFAARPLVRDYRFGLHLVWNRGDSRTGGRQPFTAGDLDQALDFAVLWGVCEETAMPWLRAKLAPLVGQSAEWSFHVRIDDETLRSIARVIGSMRPVNFAGAAAAAMEPASGAGSVSARRSTFAPLWSRVLDAAEHFNVNAVAANAAAALGAGALANLEAQVARQRASFQYTVAGLVQVNPDLFVDCGRFTYGCRLLADAVAAGAADDGVIAKVYDNLVKLWTQSHYVRMLGAHLIDVARACGDPAAVQRTMKMSWGTQSMVVSSNDAAKP